MTIKKETKMLGDDDNASAGKQIRKITRKRINRYS